MNDIRQPTAQELILERSMRDLAARIATRLRQEAIPPSPHQASGSGVVIPPPSPSSSPQLTPPLNPVPISSHLAHPSQERLSADSQFLSELLDFLNPKPCIMEPGRPCDQCDLCNTRGF